MIFIPNWFIHIKWAQMAGIPLKIAEFVNRSIDYGSDWAVEHEDEGTQEGVFENNIHRQLVYFYNKDIDKKNFVKACYLHHLLDYFKETYVNINNEDLVFQKFLEHKVISKISYKNKREISFEKEISELFQLIKNQKKTLYSDLEII
ncbi:MAG: hypothetical protein ACQERB_08345 [Promethearchaeati archaeon]